MSEYLKQIEHKIKKNISLEEIKIIDNSSKHAGHKFYDKSKFHLSLQIKSKYLNQKDKLSAQREIFKVLKDDLKEKIHALEINIKKNLKNFF